MLQAFHTKTITELSQTRAALSQLQSVAAIQSTPIFQSLLFGDLLPFSFQVLLAFVGVLPLLFHGFSGFRYVFFTQALQFG